MPDIVLFAVQIAEIVEPAVVEIEGIIPGVQGSLAMEIGGTIRDSRVLISGFGLGPSVVEVLVSFSEPGGAS